MLGFFYKTIFIFFLLSIPFRVFSETYMIVNLTGDKIINLVVEDGLKLKIENNIVEITSSDSSREYSLSDIKSIYYTTVMGIDNPNMENNNSSLVIGDDGFTLIGKNKDNNICKLFDDKGNLIREYTFSEKLYVSSSTMNKGLYIVKINDCDTFKIYVK